MPGKRTEYKILLILHKYLNGIGPSYLCELLNVYVPKRNLRSSLQNKLVVPKTRLRTFGDKSFSVTAPRLWNSLPDFVKSIGNFEIFKKRLKTYLFY